MTRDSRDGTFSAIGQTNQPREFEEVWRGKWLGDGAFDLEQLSRKLRAEADRLDKMRFAGVRLRERIDDDWGFLVTDNPAVAERFGMSEVGDGADGDGEAIDEDADQGSD